MMKIFMLFPVALAQVEFERKFTDKESHAIKLLVDQTRPNIHNQVTKNTAVLDLPEFMEIKSYIHLQCENYLNNVYQPEEKVTIEITQSWINCTLPGQKHHLHRHPNSFLSGCLYLNVDSSDVIRFFTDRYDAIKLSPVVFNEFNSDSWTVPVSNGTLLIWPSGLQHDVPPTTSTRDRVSLSFNTWIRGTIGSETKLGQVKL